MTQDELERRILKNLPGGPAQFGPLVFIVIAAVVSSVVGWFVRRCLDRHVTAEQLREPGWFSRRRLDRAIREACSDAARTPEARGLGLTAADIRREYADEVREALLRTAAGADDHDLATLRASARPEPEEDPR